MLKLSHPVRDPRTGRMHRMGEALVIVRQGRQLGEHRPVYFAKVGDDEMVLFDEDLDLGEEMP
jgi:hypothetical protein